MLSMLLNMWRTNHAAFRLSIVSWLVVVAMCVCAGVDALLVNAPSPASISPQLVFYMAVGMFWSVAVVFAVCMTLLRTGTMTEEQICQMRFAAASGIAFACFFAAFRFAAADAIQYASISFCILMMFVAGGIRVKLNEIRSKRPNARRDWGDPHA